MNTLTIYGVATVVAIILISNNTNAMPNIEDDAERVAKFYDARNRNDENNLADEINIVFGETDVEPTLETLGRQHPVRNTRKGRHWQQSRDRRQSWNYPLSYADLHAAQQQQVYGSLYDAYGTPAAKTESRSYYPYPNPGLNGPFNAPQYLPPSPHPTTINNYYFIGFPIAPWRVDSPWFSPPFVLMPGCHSTEAPVTTSEKPATPPSPNKEEKNTTANSLDDRLGPIWGDNSNNNGNNVDNGNTVDPFKQSNYSPVTSPIDLTPAKPRRPPSRIAPESDHRLANKGNSPTNSGRRPTSNSRRPTTQSHVSNLSTNRISTTKSPFKDRFSSTETPFEDRVSTPVPESNVNVDPPSRCINAIISCCRPNSTSFSQSCFEDLGCNGVFWDSNPCSGEVAKAAMNVYNVFRNSFRS